jgi:hypothetical protein
VSEPAQALTQYVSNHVMRLAQLQRITLRTQMESRAVHEAHEAHEPHEPHEGHQGHQGHDNHAGHNVEMFRDTV